MLDLGVWVKGCRVLGFTVTGAAIFLKGCRTVYKAVPKFSSLQQDLDDQLCKWSCHVG